MNNTSDNTYLHYLHNVITNIPKTDVDNKNQKRYDILLSILILAPIFIAPTVIALGYTMIGILILVVCYSLVAIIGINKRKNINKRFYKIKNAYKNIKLNNIADEKIINELYDNSALTFIINPSNKLFDFIYNWLNNNKLLKEEILNIYMFDGKTLKDIFNYNDINEQIVFLCIFLKDLDLNNSNLKQFSKERYAAGVKYLDEIIKRPIMDKVNEPKDNYKKINITINNKTKEELIKSLPEFKYHPNLYTNGMVTFANGKCQCCEKEVNAYIETMYCKEYVDCICLDCVADGSAAKKFDGSFIQDAEEINNPKAIEELYSRTPGYYSWQGEYWLACCNDYCEFVGDVGTKELNEMGITDEVFNEYSKKHSTDEEKIAWFKERLTARGDVAGYLFKCRKCGKNHLHIDMS